MLTLNIVIVIDILIVFYLMKSCNALKLSGSQ